MVAEAFQGLYWLEFSRETDSMGSCVKGDVLQGMTHVVTEVESPRSAWYACRLATQVEPMPQVKCKDHS